MPNKLSKEFTELINEVFSKSHEGESWGIRIAHIGKELADVIAVVLDALDEENKVAELASFKRDIRHIIDEAITKADVKPPRFVAMVLPAVIRSGVDWVVDELVESGQTVDQWSKENLVPALKEIDSVILHWIQRLTREGK